MSPGALQWLYEKASECVNVIEIGCWMGRSTHAFLSGCRGTVYAVDHFKGSPSEIDTVHVRAKTENIHQIFLSNVGHFSNLVTLKMDSIEASKLFGEKWFDMVFIDGDHDYQPVKNDIEAWLPKCKKFFCGHDLAQGGVRQALTEAGLGFEIVAGSIWMVKL